MTAKLAIRNDMRSAHCAPDDPGFRAWRLRQKRRCLLEFGPSSRSQVHAPVMFELSDGCSVGCPFCGVAAQRLRAVFRHNEENARLWRDVLARLHSLVGDACARGTCYYATEGLDNPDYELFLADILGEGVESAYEAAGWLVEEHAIPAAYAISLLESLFDHGVIDA